MRITKLLPFILVLTTLLTSLNSYALTKADSLIAILNSAQNDTLCVQTLNKLSILYTKSNPKISLEYALKAEKLAEKCNYNDGLAIAFYNIGDLYLEKGNDKLALNSYQSCLDIYMQNNNRLGLINTYDQMGLIYRKQKQYNEALRYHNKSLSINAKYSDTTRIANSYRKIGLDYAEQGRYDKALIWFYNGLRLNETINDKLGMANSYGNIGIIYFEIESYDQAVINLERGLRIFENIKIEEGIAESLLYLGEIYQTKKKYRKAIEALNRSLSINNKTNNTKGIADAYLIIGEIKTLIGKHSDAYTNYIKSFENYNTIKNYRGIVDSRLALAKYYYYFNDFENSKSQLIKVYKLSQKNNLLKQELEISNLLANIYFKQENYYKASITLLKANAISDTLYIKNTDKEIAEIKMQYEFDKKMQQKEIEAVRLESKNQLEIQKLKTAQFISIIALFLIALISLIIFRKSSEIKKKNKILEQQQKLINTHLKELKEQKIDLKKASSTKDKFLSVIGNDLRFSFNGINSFISKITDDRHKLNEKSLLKYLYLIKDSGANAMSLLDNLLEWTKSNNSNFTANNQPAPINSILRGNILLIKEVSQQKNIEIIEDFNDNPTVLIDKNMINTVIRNLLSNALKFTNNGGKIWIKTIIKDDEIKVIIQDTGIGISEDDLNTILELKNDKFDIRSPKSSGLGLVLCKELLLHHRQDLKVDSKLGFGTTFWFYLPIIEPITTEQSYVV